jgi:hypothetical protein
MRHFFLRNQSGFPVACIASAVASALGQYDPAVPQPLQAGPDGKATIAYTTSIFNERDVFNRKRAVAVAQARLIKHKRVKLLAVTPKEVKVTLLSELANHRLPRVAEAAGFQLAVLREKARLAARAAEAEAEDGA